MVLKARKKEEQEVWKRLQKKKVISFTIINSSPSKLN